LACLLVACAKIDLTPDLLPLSKDTMMLLGKKAWTRKRRSSSASSRKSRSWRSGSSATTAASTTQDLPDLQLVGRLGPKTKQATGRRRRVLHGQPRADEPRLQLSSGHQPRLPERLRQVAGTHGQFLMIHGKCKSVGCYAMTDALIEEIYALARESFLGANDSFQVHAFPFHMTRENMARHANHEAYPFWRDAERGLRLLRVQPADPDGGGVQPALLCERRLAGRLN
jgi:hypothetical protein